MLSLKPEKEQPFEASYLQFEFKVNIFIASHKRNKEKEILQTFGCLDFRISARGAVMYIYDILTQRGQTHYELVAVLYTKPHL